MDAPIKKPRGFAAMDPEVRREIARKGGRAVHVAGTGHQFTIDEARVAGRKGGLASHAARRRRQESQQAARKVESDS